MKITHAFEHKNIKATLVLEVPYEAFALLLGADSPHLIDSSISSEALAVMVRRIKVADEVHQMLFEAVNQLHQNLVLGSLDALTEIKYQ